MSASVLFDAPGPKAIMRGRIYNVIAVLLAAAGLWWLIATLAAPRVTAGGATLPGLFDPSRWDIFFTESALWGAIGKGLWSTLSAAAVASVLAILIGIVFAILGTSGPQWIRSITNVVLEFFRGMPVLLMIFFILIVFMPTQQFMAVVLGLAVYNGALIGEMLRAGLKSLPRGQREAGLTIGLTGFHTRMVIEFPQAFRQMTPIIVAQLVVLLKDTSLGYIVTYPELVRTTMNFMVSFYGSTYLFSFFFVTLAIYLAVNMLVSTLARYLSKRMTQSAVRKPKKLSVALPDPAANDPMTIAPSTAPFHLPKRQRERPDQ